MWENVGIFRKKGNYENQNSLEKYWNLIVRKIESI